VAYNSSNNNNNFIITIFCKFKYQTVTSVVDVSALEQIHCPRCTTEFIDKRIVSTDRKFAYKYIVTREEMLTDNYDAVIDAVITGCWSQSASSESEKNQFALEAKQCRLGRRNWTRAGDWTDT